MNNKIYGCDCDSHMYENQPPIIHVHNDTPFEDYNAALTALKGTILHPGEIIVAYYYDVAADDNVSAIIATGPIQQGGSNEIFKNAQQIEDLAEYLKNIINAQDTGIKDLTDNLREQILADTSALNQQHSTEIHEYVENFIEIQNASVASAI